MGCLSSSWQTVVPSTMCTYTKLTKTTKHSQLKRASIFPFIHFCVCVCVFVNCVVHHTPRLLSDNCRPSSSVDEDKVLSRRVMLEI